MLNIVIPMAGRGSRFLSAGYTVPKPLIPVCGRPMIEVVINNLRPRCDHRFFFICLEEHVETYSLLPKLQAYAPGASVICIEDVTAGAASTVLRAKEHIDSNDPLMIANSDQWVDVDVNDYLDKMMSNDIDGLIMTMWANDPKWSFLRANPEGLVVDVVEKQVISNEATVGIYNFRKGGDFVMASENMISKNIRVNNEFYVAPVFNELIQTGKKIGYWNIGREGEGMYGLGLPADLELFENLSVAKKATSF